MAQYSYSPGSGKPVGFRFASWLLIAAVGACLPCESVRGGTIQEQPPVANDKSQPVEVPELDKLLETLETGDTFQKEAAAAWLAEYPDRVDEFARPLANLFVQHDDSLTRVADDVFKFLGEKAVPEIEPLFLPENLDDRQASETWRMACGMINAIGDPAREKYEPRLLELLRDSSDFRVRLPAIYALTGFSNGSPDAIELLDPDLQHENFNVNLVACRLIIQTGSAASGAVPELRRLLTEGGLSQRSHAAWALGAIGPTDDFDPVPAITPLLENFSIADRERALTGLGLMGKHSAEVVPLIRPIMTSSSNLDALAAYVIWQITGDTETTVPRLIELTRSPELEFAAIDFLRQMGSSASAATETVVQLLQSEDFSIRASAVDCLVAINPRSMELDKHLEQLASDPHPLVRLAVRRACQAKMASK